MRLKEIILKLLNFFSGLFDSLLNIFASSTINAGKRETGKFRDISREDRTGGRNPSSHKKKQGSRRNERKEVARQKPQEMEPPDSLSNDTLDIPAATAPVIEEAKSVESEADFEMAEEPSSQEERDPQQGLPTATAIHLRGDIVNVSAYCQEEIVAGQSFLLNVYAHLYEQKEEVSTMARDADEHARLQAGKSLNMPVLRGTSLYFHLLIEDWEIENPQQQLVWYGVPTSVEFEIAPPSLQKQGSVIATLIISNMHGPIGRLKFNLQIIESAKPMANETPAQVESLAYSQAYMSFAPEDISSVDIHLLNLKQTGVSFIRTRENTFDDWELELVNHLKESELFYLFWSTAAESSEIMESEWQYALRFRNSSKGRLPDIIPVIIENPGPKPPEELAFLNFLSAGPAPQLSLKQNCINLLDSWNEGVFNILINHFQRKEDLHEELIALRRRWNNLEKQKRMGLTSEEELSRNKLTLTYKIQTYIGRIE